MLRSLERAFKRVVVAAFGASTRFSPPPQLFPETIHRIIVVRPHNQLGDMLCATPLLRALRNRFPVARIVLMTSPVNHDVMLHLRYVDEIICFDKLRFTSGGIAGLKRLFEFRRELRKQSFDLAIVPSTVSMSFTSDVLAWLTRAPIRIGAGSLDGVRNPSGFLFNIPIHLDWRKSLHRHQTLRNLDIVGPLRIEGSDLSHEMTLTGEEISKAAPRYADRIGRGDLAIALHPGAGKPPNRWPAERFADLAKVLGTELHAKIFVTLGPMDGGTRDELRRLLRFDVEWIDTMPIREVAACLRMMDLVIANDTGIMHVAAAVGTPVLSLFGPTDPEQWAPIAPKNRYIYGKEGRIENIPLDEVLNAARGMVQRPGKDRTEAIDKRSI